MAALHTVSVCCWGSCADRLWGRSIFLGEASANTRDRTASAEKKKSTQGNMALIRASSATASPKMLPLKRRTQPSDVMAGTTVIERASAAMDELDFERGVCIPFRKYTPEGVRQTVLHSSGSLLSVVTRGVEILFKLGLYWASLCYDCLIGRGQEMVPLRAEQLRNLLCDLGPSFIKAGQVLANRPDIIREDYMNELCILQDDVPAFPNKVAFEIIEEQLGAPLEQVFEMISAETVAAASLGQVYRATFRGTREEVAVKVQRPGIEPIIYRDLFLFRTLASFLNGLSKKKLGCNAELIVDEFGEKLLEELDYTLEARNIEDFIENFKNDPTVKIPRVYKRFSGSRVLVMEWIDGIRCTNPQGIKDARINVSAFITVGVSAALRQLLEFGLFHGDPHPGNIFAMRDGRIAYVDFGNVAVLSQQNKQILIDAVVHAVNEDYIEMANDFTRLGFLAPGTDVIPIVPALEAIWKNSTDKGLADFNFRTVTGKFNQLAYQYPIRIPERFSLVIRSLLTQEGICLTLEPNFKFLEVAYPYVAKRLLTDPDPALRERLLQVLFKDGLFQWKRLENLIVLAREQVEMMNRNASILGKDRKKIPSVVLGKLDLTDTIKDGARVVIMDAEIRRQLLMAFTEDSRLHIQELLDIYRLIEGEFNLPTLITDLIQGLPVATRDLMLSWSDSLLKDYAKEEQLQHGLWNVDSGLFFHDGRGSPMRPCSSASTYMTSAAGSLPLHSASLALEFLSLCNQSSGMPLHLCHARFLTPCWFHFVTMSRLLQFAFFDALTCSPTAITDQPNHHLDKPGAICNSDYPISDTMTIAPLQLANTRIQDLTSTMMEAIADGFSSSRALSVDAAARQTPRVRCFS